MSKSDHMNLLSERENEAIGFARKLIEGSNLNDYREIQEYIRDNKAGAIVKFMREDDYWKSIALSGLRESDIDGMYDLSFVSTARVFVKTVNTILFNHFCTDLIDLNYEIDEYLNEGEPTLDQINAEHNAYFEEQRA